MKSLNIWPDWIVARVKLGSALHILQYLPACVDPDGDKGSGSLLKNHKNIGFLSKTDQILF